MEKPITQEELANKWLDIVVSLLFPELTRVHTQKLIKEESVLVDDKPRGVSYSSAAGECLSVTSLGPEATEVLPENIPFGILHKDKGIIVINKPEDVAAHSAAGHTGGTLVNALLYHCRDSLPGINGILRPGIMHRIDRDTTGAIIVCKNNKVHQCVAEQLKVHSITRRHLVLTQGRAREEEGTVDAPLGRDPENRRCMKSDMIGGKYVVTRHRVLEHFAAVIYLEYRLETGWTHQIRVRLASLGHSLLGDTAYGSGKSPYRLEGQCLHATVLGFRHPADGHHLKFTAPFPTYLKALLDKSRQKA